ncbi:hypothetical protein ACFOET_03055 [Parapedobacter deserti]|uniref:DUF4397 domain-containing protein n=1 Tax=Parapedobacter deserti TaxID=1912957 RepID=A0ABV7JJW7_9SPHI
MMKKYFLRIASLACIALLGSCLRGDDPEPIPSGGMTFINTFIEAREVYYRLDNNVLAEVYPLGYRTYGPSYRPLPLYVGSSRRFEVYSSVEGARLVDTNIMVVDSALYSSFVYGTHDAPRHFITEDRIPENTDDPRSIAAVRFYNLANTAHRVTLRIGDAEPIEAFSNRATETPETGKAGEDFIPVPTGTYTLTVVDENGETLAERQAVVNLAGGSYTSVFLTGDDRDPTTYYVGMVRQWVN